MAAGEEKLREPFLKNEKRYYENCPGCKVDQLKDTKSGLPITELFSIWIIVLCTGKFWLFALKGCFPFSFFSPVYLANLSSFNDFFGQTGDR